MVKAGKRVAIYCRVSTKDKGQTTENQRLALEQWAANGGCTVVQLNSFILPSALDVPRSTTLIANRVVGRNRVATNYFLAIVLRDFCRANGS
jgi:hypothetical protein